MNASRRLPGSLSVPPDALGRLPDASGARPEPIETSGRPRPDDSAIVEIGGRARPEVLMSKESSVTKVDRAVKVIGGLKALFGPREKVWVEGKVWRRDDLIALFASHTAAIRDKNARYLAYLASVAAEKALARQTNAVWLALRNTVSTAHGPAAIVKVGLQPYKKPGPKTIASKLAGVQKRAARKRPT